MIGTLGDDPSTAQPDEVFGVFEAFLNSMAEARQENLAAKKRKEEEEKRSIQEAEVYLSTLQHKTQTKIQLLRLICADPQADHRPEGEQRSHAEPSGQGIERS